MNMHPCPTNSHIGGRCCQACDHGYPVPCVCTDPFPYCINGVTLYMSDCQVVLKHYPNQYFNALVTDPPCSNSNWAPSDVGDYLRGNGFDRLLKSNASIIILSNPIEGYWYMRGGNATWTSQPKLRASSTHHPNARPTAELRALLQVLHVEGPVLDPYAGGGSVLAAAQALGIAAVGIEIEPSYCNAAVAWLRKETIESGV